jgi:hypothetical protein
MNSQMNGSRKIDLKSCALAIALAALISPVAMSDNGKSGKPDKPCDAGTLRGAYGIQMQGTRPVPPPTGGVESVVGVVWRSYDGDGNFEQLDSIKGSVTGIVPNRPGLGTYEVSADCTGTTSFQPDPNNPNFVIVERFVIVDGGNEIRSIGETPAALMVTSVATRVRKH